MHLKGTNDFIFQAGNFGSKAIQLGGQSIQSPQHRHVVYLYTSACANEEI